MTKLTKSSARTNSAATIPPASSTAVPVSLEKRAFLETSLFSVEEGNAFGHGFAVGDGDGGVGEFLDGRDGGEGGGAGD